MLGNFLTLSTLLTENTNPNQGGSIWILLGVCAAFLVILFVLNFISRKKSKKQADQILELLKPGNKVKTNSGVCGIIYEINREENTFILETGSDKVKSHIKFDLNFIWQTDVKLEVEDKSTAEVKPEKPVTEPPKNDTVIPEKEEKSSEKK